jgi:Domain of unknown function (DUF4279)
MNNRSFVTLRIDSPIFSSQEISKRLKLDPERVLERGEHFYKSRKKRSETTWLYKSDFPEENLLDEHLKNILNIIGDKKAEFIELSNNGCAFVLFCFYSSDNGQGGIILNNDLIKKLAVWPFDVVIDIHLSNSH